MPAVAKNRKTHEAALQVLCRAAFQRRFPARGHGFHPSFPQFCFASQNLSAS